MDWKVWTAYAVLVIVIGLITARRPNGVQRAVDKAANTSGLGVTPEIRPLLLRRTRAMRLGDVIGAAAGVALGTVLVVLHTDVPVQTFVVQGTIIAGGGAGALIGGLIATHGLRTSGRRVARDRAVRVADYISPIERIGALVAMLLAVAVGALALVLGAGDPRIALASSVAVGAWLASELGARHLVRRPQTAETALALAWDDALRSGSVRRLAGAASAVSLYALLTAAWFLTHELLPADAASGVLLTVTIGTVVVLIAIRLALSMSPKAPGRFFRDRLWPDTVAYAPERVVS